MQLPVNIAPWLLAGGIGILLGHVRSIVRWFGPVTRNLVSSLTVDSDESQFAWIKAWLIDQVKTTHLRAATFYHNDGPRLVGHSDDAVYSCVPAHGLHWLRYDGRMFTVRYSVEWHAERKIEQIAFAGCGNCVAAFQKIIESAKAAYDAPSGEWIKVYANSSEYWNDGGLRRMRSIESVILPGDLSQSLLADAKNFMGSCARYADLGIPWRRGYLVDGPPGSGKSSLALAIASELGLPVYILTIHHECQPQTVAALLNSVPKRSMLLIEDADALFVNREQTDKPNSMFQAVLNSLDGLSASEGRLLFMTTNHVGRLDPALIRPGRCDKHIHLGDPTSDQIRNMFRRFNPYASERDEDTFLKDVQRDGLSMSGIQSRLIVKDDLPVHDLALQ